MTFIASYEVFFVVAGVVAPLDGYLFQVNIALFGSGREGVGGMALEAIGDVGFLFRVVGHVDVGVAFFALGGDVGSRSGDNLIPSMATRAVAGGGHGGGHEGGRLGT